METILLIVFGLAALYAAFTVISTVARFAFYTAIVLIGVEIVLRWGAQTSLLVLLGIGT